MEPKLVVQTPRYSVWDLDGLKVRLAILNHGSIVVRTEGEYNDAKYFPIVDKYDDEYWNRQPADQFPRFLCQKPGEYPTPDDCLPNGWQDIYDWAGKEKVSGDMQRARIKAEDEKRRAAALDRISHYRPYMGWTLKERGYHSEVPECKEAKRRRLSDEQRAERIALLHARYPDAFVAQPELT